MPDMFMLNGIACRIDLSGKGEPTAAAFPVVRLEVLSAGRALPPPSPPHCIFLLLQHEHDIIGNSPLTGGKSLGRGHDLLSA